MDKIRLARLDTLGEEEFRLSEAETIIGRGPILGCDDKRVSRNHGVIKLLPDSGITLVATHTNPCFYKLQSEDLYAILSKGEEKVLTFGDEFSLLPDSFRYRVALKRECSNNKLEEDVVGKTLVCNGFAKTEEGCTELVVSNGSVGKNLSVIADTEASTSTRHTRNLPTWLTHLPTTDNTPRPLTKGTKRRLRNKPDSPSNNKKLKANDGTSVPNEEVATTSGISWPTLESAAARVSVKEQLSDEEDVAKDDSVSPTVDPRAAANYSSIVSQVTVKEQLSNEEVVTKDGYEAEYGDSLPLTTDAPSSAANQGSSTSRESCVYGKDCYRKNPQHRVEFSHPGDSDFKDADENTDRPECEYGTSCYRKNTQHRRDYKHTQPWKRPRPPPPPTSNVFCDHCTITYTLCTRCHATDVDFDDLPKQEPDSD